MCVDVQFGVWVDIACLRQHGGQDNSKVTSNSIVIVCTFLAAFVTAEGMVVKDIMVVVSACATCVWWINWEA